uniref:Uncharacterized protein n=1 Tax=Bactrocera latifrons TaxID=174628 RepID=A0A0K8VJZ2_BACLA
MMNSNAMKTPKSKFMQLQHFGERFENVGTWEPLLRPRSFSDAFVSVLAKVPAQQATLKEMDISYGSDIADPNESTEKMICDCSAYSDVLEYKHRYLPIFPLLGFPRTSGYLAAKIGLSKGTKRQRDTSEDCLEDVDEIRPKIKRRLVVAQGSCLTAASVGRHLFPFILANQGRFGKLAVKSLAMKLHKRDGKLCKPLNALKAAKIMRDIRTTKRNENHS